jgi:hypothetical protein
MRKINKKGIGEVLYWSLRFVLIGVVAVSILIFSERFFNDRLEVGDLEHSVLMNRVFNTFAYTSTNTGRVYPNIIDEERFTQENLEGSLISSKNLAVKATLNKKTIFLDQNFYELSSPLKGISKYQEIAQSSFVQILTKEKKLVSGRIDISIIYEAK